MSSRNISWEIILAGLAFVAIATYMLANSSEGNHSSDHREAHPPAPPEAAHLPSSIVIDLQNLDNLKDLEKLQNLEHLKNLEFELKNLDKIIEAQVNTEEVEKSVEKSLREVEEKLQEIEKADFQVKLQNKKIFISKDYDVQEANWTEVNPGVFVFRESFDVPQNGSLRLNLGFGNLNIIGKETSSGELTIRATGNVSSAQEIKDRLRVTTNTDADNTTFDIASAEDARLSDEVNLEATLSVPTSITLNASTQGGHISANNLNGKQQLLTSGGHIVLDAISGITTAESRGGHITCDQLSGEAILKTSGGHIQVTDANANLTASTGGGHIELDDFSGQADAKTSGGNITANINSATGPLSFATSAGNINITIPQSLAADLNAKGNNVWISDAFSFDGTKSEGHVTGALNGGGIPLTLVCKYGNVSIEDE